MATFETSRGMSRSMMPPCIVARVAFWCFLATLTPSTITRPFVGSTRVTLPSLPRSLPLSTRMRSPFLIFSPAISAAPSSSHTTPRRTTSQCATDVSPLRGDKRHCAHGSLAFARSLQHLRRKRDDAHELLVAQFAAHRAEDARAARLL